MKNISKEVNQDLKILTSYINANKVCLNISKTEALK